MNKSIKSIMYIIGLFLFISFVTVGCGQKQEEAVMPDANEIAVQKAEQEKAKRQQDEIEKLHEEDFEESKLVSYDVVDIGRKDPFMPYGEYQAFEDARKDAINEANAHNARIAQYKKNANIKIRELDDISPYKFNLPVPPTSLASPDAAAAKITRTKVVGIMYNATSPSAIINVDDKDYLVRPGDKIIDQEYKVVKINPNWITVSLGSNVYSAAIGELFAKDGLNESKNDLYNMENRFGGRKS